MYRIRNENGELVQALGRLHLGTYWAYLDGLGNKIIVVFPQKIPDDAVEAWRVRVYPRYIRRLPPGE